MVRPALRLALIVVAASLAAAGVASLRPASAAGIDGCTDRPTSADPFGCDRWVLTAASGEGPYSAWVEDARVRLRTERVDGYETVVVGTECSSVTAPFTIDGALLVPEEQPAWWDECEDRPGPAEIRLLALLSAPVVVGGTPEDIVLEGTGGSLVFSRIPG